MRLFDIFKGGPGSGNFGHKGIPGQRGGSAPRSGVAQAFGKITDAAYQSIIENDGVTINLEGAQPQKGYAYSPYKDTEIVEPASEFSIDDVRKFVHENIDKLQQPGHYIGGWVDDNKVYMDVSVVGDPSAETIATAEGQGQLAVFDLESFETIYTSLGKSVLEGDFSYGWKKAIGLYDFDRRQDGRGNS
jgi:hypothetical protein